jgi:hypothetical protein
VSIRRSGVTFFALLLLEGLKTPLNLREELKHANVPGIENVLVVMPMRNANAVAGTSRP